MGSNNLFRPWSLLLNDLSVLRFILAQNSWKSYQKWLIELPDWETLLL